MEIDWCRRLVVAGIWVSTVCNIRFATLIDSCYNYCKSVQVWNVFDEIVVEQAGVVSLQKLLVREKAGQESRGIYLISSNPANPEMFELKVHKPKDKQVWIQAIRWDNDNEKYFLILLPEVTWKKSNLFYVILELQFKVVRKMTMKVSHWAVKKNKASWMPSRTRYAS